jgi:hypothetical protein
MEEKGKSDSSNTTCREMRTRGGEVVAPIPLVVKRVTKENALYRVGRQLVRSSGDDVRVIGTAEDMEVIVAGRGTTTSLVRGGS